MLNPVCHTHTHRPTAQRWAAGSWDSQTHFLAPLPGLATSASCSGGRGGGPESVGAWWRPADQQGPFHGPLNADFAGSAPPDYAHQPAVLLRSCVSQRPHCSPPQVTSSPYSPREPPEDKDVKLRHTLRDLASESTRPATSNSSEGGAEGWREGGRAHPRRRRNILPASPGCPQGRAVFVDRTQGHPEPCAGRTPGRSSQCYRSTKFGCPSGSGF